MLVSSTHSDFIIVVYIVILISYGVLARLTYSLIKEDIKNMFIETPLDSLIRYDYSKSIAVIGGMLFPFYYILLCGYFFGDYCYDKILCEEKTENKIAAWFIR